MRPRGRRDLASKVRGVEPRADAPEQLGAARDANQQLPIAAAETAHGIGCAQNGQQERFVACGAGHRVRHRRILGRGRSRGARGLRLFGEPLEQVAERGHRRPQRRVLEPEARHGPDQPPDRAERGRA